MKKLLRTAAALLTIGWWANSQAADDNAAQAGEPAAEHPAKSADPSLGGEVPTGLTQADFEAALKGSFAGTFVFYSRLDDKGKAAVYQAYQESNQIAHIRETTLTLLKH